MHTQNIGNTTFTHNSDLSGPVRIHTADGELLVPGEHLIEFIAGWVASQRIAALELATAEEVLGFVRR